MADLFERFSPDRKVFLFSDYKEEQLRAEFLNPFFTALGRDMNDALDTIRTRNRGSVPLSLGSSAVRRPRFTTQVCAAVRASWVTCSGATFTPMLRDT